MQTTDVKVNEVSPALFAAAPDAAAMAKLPPAEVERLIKTVGLAPTKSRNLVRTAQLLLERHAGEVPQTFEELEALPGVGHKTASVVMVQCHGCALAGSALTRGPSLAAVARSAAATAALCLSLSSPSPPPPLQAGGVPCGHPHPPPGAALGPHGRRQRGADGG